MLGKNPFARIPLLPATLSFSIGVAGGLYMQSFIIAGTLVLFAILFAFFKKHLLSTLSITLLLGYCDSAIRYNKDISEYLAYKNGLIFSGEILDKRESDTSQSLLVAIDRTGRTEESLNSYPETAAMINVMGFQPEYSVGQRIVFKTKLHTPQPRLDLPDENDYTHLLENRFIRLQAVIPTDSIIDVENPISFRFYCYRVRDMVTTLIYRSSLNAETKEFLNATLTGDGSDLKSEVRDSFNTSGISHILALSGLHVGIIALVISIAMFPLMMLGMRRIHTIIILLALWCFAAITGFSPSVIRAVIMATVVIVGNMMQRYKSPLNSLCLAALVILLFDPASIVSIGFQLSFAAVLCIIIFSRSLNPISERNRIGYNLFSYLTVSISAMIGTGLLSVIYFHSFPVYFLLTNIIVAFILPFLLGGGVLLIICEALGFDPIWLCNSIDFIYNFVAVTSEWIATIPGASISNIYIPAWLCIPYAVWITTLKIWSNKKNALGLTGFLSATIIMICLIATTPQQSRDTTVYLARDTYDTSIVEVSPPDNILHIISTAANEKMAIRNRAEFRYSDFMGRRGIDSIYIESPQSGRRDTTLLRHGQSISLLWGRPDRLPATTDYLIICRGTTADIPTILRYCKPDTILLSYDLHIKRAKRYCSECRDAGVPYKSMRESGWKLSPDLNCWNPR